MLVNVMRPGRFEKSDEESLILGNFPEVGDNDVCERYFVSFRVFVPFPGRWLRWQARFTGSRSEQCSPRDPEYPVCSVSNKGSRDSLEGPSVGFSDFLVRFSPRSQPTRKGKRDKQQKPQQ